MNFRLASACFLLEAFKDGSCKVREESSTVSWVLQADRGCAMLSGVLSMFD